MSALLRNERLLVGGGLALAALGLAAAIGLRAELAPMVALALAGVVALLLIMRRPLVGVGLCAALVMTGGLSQVLEASIFQRLYVIFFAFTCLAYANLLLGDRQLMRHWLRLRVADLLLLGMLVTAALSLAVAPEWHRGTDSLETLLKGVALYVVVSRAIRSADDLVFVAKFMLVGGVWQASTAWTGQGAATTSGAVTRLSGNLDSINAFAFALMRAFPWALFFCFFGRGLWRWLGLAGTVLLSLTALATVSRTAAAVLVIVAVLWACFSTRSLDRRLRSLALMLVVLALGLSIYGGQLAQRWAFVRELSNTSNVAFVVDDDGGRAEMRAAAIAIIADHPVFGVGIGNTPFFLMQELYRRRPFPVHNMYLEVGADLGLVGLAFFVGLAALGYLRAAALWARTRDDRSCALIATCVAALATWSIFGASGNWHYINFAYLLVACVHLLPEILARGKREDPATAPSPARSAGGGAVGPEVATGRATP
ncbi:MAG TPA: O-antigen ligase family protein [Chloroflexaceae bacterium]|nr:O-antigen ligase family protein [Chloroflexaceae bacterium]